MWEGFCCVLPQSKYHIIIIILNPGGPELQSIMSFSTKHIVKQENRIQGSNFYIPYRP